MKEKDFEVVVPAYDALEAELEDILGGKCNRCKLGSCPSLIYTCAKEGERAQDSSGCCEGLRAVPFDNGIFVCLAV